MRPFFWTLNNAFAASLGIFADYERSGTENVPPHGPLIVIANHQSNIDPPVVARSLARNTLFFAKRELFGNFVFRTFLRYWGAHPINRDTPGPQAFRRIMGELRAPNGCITLFPEGTRSPGSLRKARTGPASVAIGTGATVIPIGITGTERLSTVFRVFNPTTRLRVAIGRPFVVELPSQADMAESPEYGHESGVGKQVLNDITDEMMGRIAELLPETYRGHYADSALAPRVHTKDLRPQ